MVTKFSYPHRGPNRNGVDEIVGYEDVILVSCEHGEIVEAQDEGHASCLADSPSSWCGECAKPYRKLSRSFDREPHDEAERRFDRANRMEAGRGMVA